MVLSRERALVQRSRELFFASRAMGAGLSGYGAIIMPISPPLYFVPKNVDEYVGGFTDKVLAQLGIRSSMGWRSKEFD